VTIDENRGIFIGFDDGSTISISLNPEDRRAEEAAIFSGGTEKWDAW
jgi:predicted esterase